MRKYPEIDNLSSMRNRALLLGKFISWTRKRDGSNIQIYYGEPGIREKLVHFYQKNLKRNSHHKLLGPIKISSRNKEKATKDIVDGLYRTEEYEKILEMLRDNPSFIIYVELLLKGSSPTKIEIHEKNEAIGLDIYDPTGESFLSFANSHQHFFHYNIPVVELIKTTRHVTIESLMKEAGEMLNLCEFNRWEGVVGKTHEGKDYLQFKVKLDMPRPMMVGNIEEGQVIKPVIPEADILGAIDKVWQDLGTEKFKDVRIAMPRVAKEVGKECEKHGYDGVSNLFTYYKVYLEGK